MVDLDFSWANGGLYISGESTIKVTRDIFMDFPMFDAITFKDKDGFPFFNFTIKTRDKRYRCNDNLRASLRDRHIFCVEVFVSKDIPYNPLLVRVQNGYKYQYFKISESVEVIRELELKTAHHYSPSDFFEALIDENYNINKKTTFRIDKKESYNHINFSTNDLANFSVYKHEPKQKDKIFTPVVLQGRTRVFETDIFEPFKAKNFDMTVYYRSGVKHSDIPLLIEFSNSNSKHYFSKENIHQKNWTPIEIDNQDSLSEKLEEIETQLFYSVTVSIHEKKSYTRGLMKNDLISKGLGDAKKEKIYVYKFDKWPIPNYVCYEHDLSVYSEGYIKGQISTFGIHMKSLFVNIFNALIKTADTQSDAHVFFVESDPKFYVWFYEGYGTIREDNLPFMIQYLNKTYIPKSKEEYFDKWVDIPGIVNIHNNAAKLKEELDKVNSMLNSIDLNHKITDTSETSKYGILISPHLNTLFDTNRILVQPKSYHKLFIQCTHSTKNGFVIGEAYYTRHIYSQGGTKEKVKSVSQLLKNKEKTCSLNVNIKEVTAYYFTYDPDSEYPLLVEYKLCDNEYEYHVLQCDFSKLLEYNLVYLTHGPKIDDKHLFSILRHQNFIFHNVISIKLDKQSTYTCCYRTNNNKYLEFVPKQVRGLKHCQFKNERHSSPIKLPFIQVEQFNKYLLYGYVVYEHSLKAFFTDNNKELLGHHFDNIKIEGFLIKNSEIKLNGSGLEGPTFVRARYVFVYFYRHDPRPLLVCYNYKAYAPLEQSTYESDWYPVEGVKNFILKSQKEFNLLDPKILDKLNATVGFLNTVNLFEHNHGIVHTYVVHTFKGKKISVKVTKEPLLIDHNPGILTCYTKLTHTPNGINGKDAKGFRLGNIVYNGNGLTGQLDYNKEGVKWYPLTSVSVYYYNYDINYKDPLLVELQFENSMALPNGTLIYYYKLICTDGSRIDWEKDKRGFYAVKYGGKHLINLLDGIRYDLKKFLKIELDKRAPYPLMLSQKQCDIKATFTILNGHQVEVGPCEKCSKLNSYDYTIFQHKISAINGDFDYNEIGGVEFTLPGTNGKLIEISLNDSKGSKSVWNMNYNKCMGDVYVYFSKDSEGYEAVPLFIHFHNQWFTPTSIEEYFKTWSCVDESKVLLKLKELGGRRKIEESVNKFKVPNDVTGLGVYSTELARSDSTEVNEKSLYNSEIFSVNDPKTLPPYVLKIPQVDLEIAPFEDTEKPCLNGFTPQTIAFGLSEDYGYDFSVQRDQQEEDKVYKILSITNVSDPDGKLYNGLQEDLNTNKSNEEELQKIPKVAALSSTGQVHYSAESNQSYLGSILGGTFGSLITIGLFTFMLFKYFRKVKIRNMIPNLY